MRLVVFENRVEFKRHAASNWIFINFLWWAPCFFPPSLVRTSILFQTELHSSNFIDLLNFLLYFPAFSLLIANSPTNRWPNRFRLKQHLRW